MATKKIWYNKEEDILNIELQKGDYWKSIELEKGIIIDITKNGMIMGIEILKASKALGGDGKTVLKRALA